MILLKTQSLNQIGVTASELKTLENPNYLFEFENIQSKAKELIYLDKINPTSKRFDLFEITLPDDIDLKTGDYLYKIYESNDLVLNTTGKAILEYGRLEVSKDKTPNNVNTVTQENNINYV